MTIPGVDNTLLFVAVVVGVVVVGGAFILRDRFSNRRSTAGATSDEDRTYTCRYCGENLDRYRNRCPRCETRNPVGYEGEKRHSRTDRSSKR
ncbi:hypothetical protein [Haladaptatus sp. NG-WS-4]